MVLFKSVLGSIFSIMSAAICKKKKYNHHNGTIRLQIIVPFPQYRAETLIYRRRNQDTNTLGLATVWIEFQTRFQKKKKTRFRR